MLYDPKWKKPETKPDVFSLESLIAWLEKQPGGETYCYFDSGGCLLTKYFDAAGFQNVYVFVDGFWHGPEKIPGYIGQDEAITLGRLTWMPALFNEIARSHRGNTFGAALARAREFHTVSTSHGTKP